MFIHKLITRYSETGQDGIIHHSAFVIYCEVARIEFFKSLGFDINSLEKKGLFCPVIDLSLKYHRPLHSLEEISIQIHVENFSKVRFSLGYTLLRGDERLVTGVISHCFVNTEFKPIPIPQEIALALSKKE